MFPSTCGRKIFYWAGQAHLLLGFDCRADLRGHAMGVIALGGKMYLECAALLIKALIELRIETEITLRAGCMYGRNWSGEPGRKATP